MVKSPQFHRVWRTAALTVAAGLLSHPAARLEAAILVAQADKPSVVATTSVLCDLTKTIAQETIDLTCLVDAGSDPHVYEPTPADARAIANADLILYAGYDFEPDIIRMIESTSNPAHKVAVSEVAVPQPLMGEPHEHGEEAHGEEAHGHEHGEEAHGEEAHGQEHGEEAHGHGHSEALAPDPHVFQNAENGAAMARVIGQELTKLNPGQTALYQSNTAQLTQKLTQIHAWIKQQIATIPEAQRQLVTTHDALAYYSAAYGIPVVGALQGISTDEQPTAQRVSDLVRTIRESNVPIVFAETTINPRLIEAVAREARVQISDRELFADGIGEPGTEGDTYPNMLIANTRAIVEGLGGTYTAFTPTPARATIPAVPTGFPR